MKINKSVTCCPQCGSYVDKPCTTCNAPVEAEKTVLMEANDIIYGDRQADYGSATENFSNIAKGWEIILKTKVTPEQVGLCMIWLKMAREMNVSKRDNIVDIAGYAGCMEKLSKGE